MRDYDNSRCTVCDQPWGVHDSGECEAVKRGAWSDPIFNRMRIEAIQYHAAKNRERIAKENALEMARLDRLNQDHPGSWFFEWALIPFVILGLLIVIPWLYIGLVVIGLVNRLRGQKNP